MTHTRRGSTATRMVAAVVLGVLVSLPITLVAALATPPPASATTYRYWTYWWGLPGASGWKFAQQGPASHAPGEGWVLGWRFGTTSANGSGGKAPRASQVYADLCGSPATASGQVRVAVVVDYGTDADAPPGESPPSSGNVRVECVQVLAGVSRGYDAMRAAGLTIRQGNDGFVCGIDGYPRTECSAAVDTAPSSSAPAAPASSAPPAATSAPTATRSTPAAPSRTATATRPAASSSTSRSATPAPASAVTSRSPGAATPSSSPVPSVSPDPSTSPTYPAPTDTPPAEVDPEAILPARSGAPVAAGAAGGAEPANAGNAMGFLGGALVVGAIAGAAWWNARRRGDAS